MNLITLLLIIILILTVFFNFCILLYFISKKYNIFAFSYIWKRKNASDVEALYGEKRQCSQIIEDAVKDLSARKVGALITIERAISMSNYVFSGVRLNADLNKYLLLAIFSNKTIPLHDGAVIIRKNKILSASSYFPLTNKPLSVKLGSRHRAALKISSITDCLAIIVSETTGKISYAKRGKLYNVNNWNSFYKIIFKSIK